MTDELYSYILGHIDAEPAHLHRLERDTHLHLLNPRMSSGHLQGRLLKMLVRMARPRRILELGTFGGYASQCLAEGMKAGGELHTIEICDELEDFIRRHLEDSPVRDRIHLHFGDAAETVRQWAEGSFDMAFIDANKREYCAYYRMVLPLVRPGGFIIADNTLWDGHVVDPHYDHDAQTAAIREFNDLAARDPRVETVMLPLRDGLTVWYKKPALTDAAE